jgi:uncharacterized membrane protein YgcG
VRILGFVFYFVDLTSVTLPPKEDENNIITRLNVYSKHYVSRRPRVGEVGRSSGPGDGDVGGSHSGGGSSGRS